MARLGLSDKTRVLHAALQLPTFTVKQLVELTGVKENTVQTVLARSKDLVEETGALESGKRGGRPTLYRLREAARLQLAREAVELAEKLREPVQPGRSDESVHRATVALDAVSSSIELGQLPAGSEIKDEHWRERAQAQLNVSRQLVRLVGDENRRAPLEARLRELDARLASPPARVANWLERLKELFERCEPSTALFGALTAAHGASSIGRFGAAAPAMLFRTGDNDDLPRRLAAALKEAQHLVLQVELRDVLKELQQPSGREVLLEALKAPWNPVVYVTMDSGLEESRGMVGGLLGVMKECLWMKNQDPPSTMPDVVLIDTNINSTWVEANQAVRNLSYMPNVRNPSAIESVIEGVVASSAPEPHVAAFMLNRATGTGSM